MADAPQFRRAVVLGTGLIGGSFALALRKYAPEIHVAGWDREGVVREARVRGAIQDAFSGELAPALAGADLIYLALPIGVRPVWVGAEQHDYAVGLSSHLPQLLAVALASFLYDRLDENGLPITLAGPGLRDTLRLAGSPYSTWRDIVLTNREYLATALDLLPRRIDELREKLASRELEGDFDAANELYKLLRSL